MKVLINGINGKMGQEVANVIDNDKDILLLGGVDKENTGIYTYPVYTNTSNIEEKPDVIIDFSVPVATLNILKYAKENHVPVVIATTGFTDKQLKEIEDYSKDIPIFKSANMSYDINLMAKIVASLAKELPDTDIEIIETHHNRKIDSPSGTALFLADSINAAKDNKMVYEFDRHNKHEKRNKLEIGFSSIRGGNIVGEHTVQFFGEHETLEITHKCYSRTVFANGAVMAAKYIVNKDNGMYNMNDLINNVKKISDTLSISIKDNNGNNSSIFKTGDKVNIKSSKEEKNYEVLIYGDVNGDGVIDKLDYLAILRHYYGYKKYDGVYKEAADVNKDGVVDKLDYLAVLRDYYGYKKIVQ